MLEIIPSILTNSPEEARALITLCEGVASRAQLDIIDGQFANNKTVFPEVFEDDYFSTKLDHHLMVSEPINWIDRCVRGNADRIIGQIELMSDQLSFCNAVLQRSISVGLGIDLDTDVEKVDTDALALCDVVLVMSVQAGFGGQTYDKRSLEKIKKLRAMREENGYRYKICDDGGVTMGNDELVAAAGADEIAVGRKIFEGDLQENIEHFKKASMR